MRDCFLKFKHPNFVYYKYNQKKLHNHGELVTMDPTSSVLKQPPATDYDRRRKMTSRFSLAQKVALVGVVLGSVLCFVSVASPFWIFVSLENSDDSFEASNLHAGLWHACGKYYGVHMCTVIDLNRSSGYVHAMRGCALLCLFLSFVSGVVAVSMIYGSQGYKNRFVSVTSFIAGAFGIAVVVIFLQEGVELASFTVMNSINVHDLVSIGWSFVVFSVGTVTLVVISFVTWFAPPAIPLRNSLRNTPSVICKQSPCRYEDPEAMPTRHAVSHGQSKLSYPV